MPVNVTRVPLKATGELMPLPFSVTALVIDNALVAFSTPAVSVSEPVLATAVAPPAAPPLARLSTPAVADVSAVQRQAAREEVGVAQRQRARPAKRQPLGRGAGDLADDAVERHPGQAVHRQRVGGRQQRRRAAERQRLRHRGRC